MTETSLCLVAGAKHINAKFTNNYARLDIVSYLFLSSKFRAFTIDDSLRLI